MTKKNITKKEIAESLSHKTGFPLSLSKKLVKLGRDEGKVLTSQWTKFAVTKWFNAEVNNRKIKNLSTEDIETLTNALKIKLIEISKN